VEAAFFGQNFVGDIPKNFMLAGKDATAQFRSLVGILDYSGMDFACETGVNHRTVFLNFAYWLCLDLDQVGVSESQLNTVLEAIRKLWKSRSSRIILPMDGQRAA